MDVFHSMHGYQSRRYQYFSDSEKQTLIQLYDKFKNTDLDEDQLRSQVNKVYNKLDELGITKEDVKGIIGKLVDFARSILN